MSLVDKLSRGFQKVHGFLLIIEKVTKSVSVVLGYVVDCGKDVLAIWKTKDQESISDTVNDIKTTLTEVKEEIKEVSDTFNPKVDKDEHDVS
jgi:hypothetical protein